MQKLPKVACGPKPKKKSTKKSSTYVFRTKKATVCSIKMSDKNFLFLLLFFRQKKVLPICTEKQLWRVARKYSFCKVLLSFFLRKQKKGNSKLTLGFHETMLFCSSKTKSFPNENSSERVSRLVVLFFEYFWNEEHKSTKKNSNIKTNLLPTSFQQSKKRKKNIFKRSKIVWIV